ncbi:MAG: hypothetical protein PHI31_09745 [Desulfuromonadaceae bacterium]|nr:hypothetical protein [Desulfuromonadaceae bacterium]
MKESHEERIERLIEEKALLVKGLDHPGTQMIFIKLKDMARASIHDYDTCDFNTEQGREKAQRIQARRYVILTEIPRIIDEIINVDLPLEENLKPWRFSLWLEEVRGSLKRFFRF